MRNKELTGVIRKKTGKQTRSYAQRALIKTDTPGRGGAWLLLTWLWRADPKQDARQEKAEATQGRRWLHCCAWQVSPFNFTCPAEYPSFTARKDESLCVFFFFFWRTAPPAASLWALFGCFWTSLQFVQLFCVSSISCLLAEFMTDARTENSGKSASHARWKTKAWHKKMRKALYSCHFSRLRHYAAADTVSRHTPKSPELLPHAPWLAQVPDDHRALRYTSSSCAVQLVGTRRPRPP